MKEKEVIVQDVQLRLAVKIDGVTLRRTWWGDGDEFSGAAVVRTTRKLTQKEERDLEVKASRLFDEKITNIKCLL